MALLMKRIDIKFGDGDSDDALLKRKRISDCNLEAAVLIAGQSHGRYSLQSRSIVASLMTITVTNNVLQFTLGIPFNVK